MWIQLLPRGIYLCSCPSCDVVTMLVWWLLWMNTNVIISSPGISFTYWAIVRIISHLQVELSPNSTVDLLRLEPVPGVQITRGQALLPTNVVMPAASIMQRMMSLWISLYNWLSHSVLTMFFTKPSLLSQACSQFSICPPTPTLLGLLV